jgi:hypothetical protein
LRAFFYGCHIITSMGSFTPVTMGTPPHTARDTAHPKK